MTDKTPVVPGQFAVKRIEYANENLMAATVDVAATAGGKIPSELSLRAAEIQAQMAIGAALLDIAQALREGNSDRDRSLFYGLEPLTKAVQALGLRIRGH